MNESMRQLLLSTLGENYDDIMIWALGDEWLSVTWNNTPKFVNEKLGKTVIEQHDTMSEGLNKLKLEYETYHGRKTD